MGVYFNPSNASFRQAKNSRIYVDKSKLIEYLNDRLSTEDKCLSLIHISKTQVKTGFSDGHNVQIESGLSEGDTVLIESRVSE